MFGIRSPILPIVLAYATGIALAGQVELPLFGASLLLLASLIALSFCLFLRLPFHYRHLPGSALLLSWLLFGLLARSWDADGIEEGKAEFGNDALVFLRILERNGSNERSIRFLARSTDPELKLLLSIKRDEKAGDLLPGDRIITPRAPERIPEPEDTADFDRRSFYASQGIHFELELAPSQYRIVSDDQGWSGPWTAALRLREKLYRALKRETPLNGDRLAVASALWLGRKSDLPDGLRKNYADAGGMHVLAVSGLHVGIFFLMLQGLTRPLKRIRSTKRVRSILILFAMWSYAALTGWSASVVRAVLMFSLYTAGQGLRRPPPIANVIAGSALLVLLFQPSMLEDIGFLLSYAAVIAIVTVHPHLEALYRPRWKLLRWLWSLLSVSIAAQIGVLPFILFAFGKFPLWFLLTNPVLLPLATLALYSGFPMALSFLVPYGPEWVGWMSGWIFEGMNAWVAWIADQPGSGFELGPISALCAFLLALALGTSVFYLHRPSMLPSWCLHASWTFLLLFLFVKELQLRDRSSIIHHAWIEPAVLSIRDGPKVTLLSSTPLKGYRKKRLRSFWKEQGVEEFRIETLSKQGRVNAAFHHPRSDVLLWSGPGTEEIPSPQDGDWELVVIGRNAPGPDSAPGSLFSCETLLIRDKKDVDAWKSHAERMGVELHVLPEDGAYVASL